MKHMHEYLVLLLVNTHVLKGLLFLITIDGCKPHFKSFTKIDYSRELNLDKISAKHHSMVLSHLHLSQSYVI